MEPYHYSVPLAPILLIQGKITRLMTPRLPEAAGARKGVAGNGPGLRLLVAGDSAAAGVGTDTQDNALAGFLLKRFQSNFRVAWQLEAKTGNTTGDTITHLESVAPSPFDLVVISTGVNDVTGGVNLKVWLQQLDHLHQLLVKKFSARQVVFSGIPPMGEFPALPQPLRFFMGKRATLFDLHLKEKVQALAKALYIGFENGFDQRAIAEDGFHPNAFAYQRWAELIGEKVVLDRLWEEAMA